MSEKETVMVLKVVDLQCPCCYNKLKKILCEFPQVRDQVYNKKANTVTITVICCNPERIRDRLCCKGSNLIKTIEIKKPPVIGSDSETENKCKEKIIVPSPTGKCCQECREGRGGGPCNHGRVARTCCQECSEGRGGGPCNHGNRARTCCQHCYDGRGGGPCYRGLGYHPYQPQPCDCGCGGYGHGNGNRGGYHYYCYTEESPQDCSIM